MQYQLAPLYCRPWTLNGITPRLIESHYERNYGGELRSVVVQTLEAINLKALEHPCLPGRKLKFRLGHRSEMEVKMNVES